MNKSRKLILSLLGVLAGFLAALPLLIGLFLQSSASSAVVGLDQQIGGASIRLISIQRHWFTSDLLLGVEPADGSSAMVYHSRLQHGPWLSGEPGWLGGIDRLVHPDLDDVLEIEWRLSPLLHLEAELRSRWQHRPSGRKLDLQLRLASDRQASDIQVELLSSSLILPGVLNIQALHGDGQFHRGADQNWRFELNLAADSLGVGQWPQLLSRMAFGFAVEAGPRQVEVSSKVTATRLQAGPDHAYRDTSARLLLRGLDRETLGTWLETILAAHKNGLRGRYLTEQINNTSLLALPSLLAHQPGFELLSMHLNSDHGQANANFSVSLPEPPAPGFLLNPASLLDVVAARGSLQLPQALARNWAGLQARAELGHGASESMIHAAGEEFLLRLRANRVLLQDGDDYRLELELSEGELILNGQSMYLPSF